MHNRIFRAIVIWLDGEIEDADDIQVFAISEAEAKREAAKKWRLTVGMRWPHCVIQEVVIEGGIERIPPHCGRRRQPEGVAQPAARRKLPITAPE